MRTTPIVATLLPLAASPAAAQAPASYPPEQIKAGAAIYERNCSPCHVLADGDLAALWAYVIAGDR